MEEKTEKRAGNVTETKSKKLVGLNKGLVITAIVLTVIAIIIVVFALVNKLNDKVYANVYLGTEKISKMTEEEVKEYIAKLNEAFKSEAISIKYEDKEIMEISTTAIDMEIDEEATLKNAMSFGRDKNLVLNNIDILKAIFKKKNIEIVYTYSDPKITSLAAEVTAEVDGKVQDDTYSLDEENYTLVITRGKSGKDIVVTEFKEDILEALKNGDTEYSLSLEIRKPKELDVDVVYAKVVREAKDAYKDETVKPVVYHKEQVGITFDKEELKKVLSENTEEGKVIKFKLTTTMPKVKIQDITKNEYKDKLGTYTSNYIYSDSNRASNVVLGASMLNGAVVMPGETFSFNARMGDCGLSSRGFKSAAVFKAGKVVQETGGGICQISSTLYIAALKANLQIVSRANHALPVGYVPVSLDATVYYPYTDFKFKNTRDYPIKIVATTTSSRYLTVSIYGTKEEKEYEIELDSWITSTIKPKVQTEKDSTMAEGKTQVVYDGSNGYKSVAYKTVKYNGKVISKTLLSEDTYGAMAKIVKVGTKKVNVYGE